MWADNETTKDFLNYEVHCNLIKEYVTNPNLLPLTIGVFGDWGSGKSSIMRMLEEKLKDDKKVLTIYFNSWLFESYEDAKISLLENILLELSKNEQLKETAKKKILELLSRVDYMKLATDGVKKYAKNVIDIIATGGIGTAIENSVDFLEKKLENISSSNLPTLNDYIKKEQDNKSKSNIKTFRKDFEELIKLTQYDSVVIFVDDLDRCMPERVIETLEAIKLFLSVDNTAFIIGADERIIKHSISMHLKLHTFKNDSSHLFDSEQIVTDYIEKLIQIPYRIPKLSLSEIETYNNLLFCKTELNDENFTQTYEKYLKFRDDDFYSAYTYGHIKEIIGLNDNPKLTHLLHLSHNISQMITTVLKGNPRQTKRFLNTFMLRSKLAEVAKLEIDIFILIKLMLLEYFDTKLFKKLNDLQSQNNGFFAEISILEAVFIDRAENSLEENFKEWQTPQLQNWIKISPRLAEIDLRNYFWLVRDKTESTLSNVHMVSPIIQKAYKGLMSEREPVQRVALETTKDFNDSDVNELLRLFDEQINISSNIKPLLDSLHKVIIKINKTEFYVIYIEIVKNISYQKIQKFMFLVDRLKEIKLKENSLSQDIDSLLKNYSEQGKGSLKTASLQEIGE